MAIVISILAFLFSIIQFFKDSSRAQKEATLNAYNYLQENVFSCLKRYDLTNIKTETDEWNAITICMAKIENFSVGINTGIYSIEILNRLGGGFFISQYEKLWPIIEKKRNEDPNSKHYDEFEVVVNKLRAERERVK